MNDDKRLFSWRLYAVQLVDRILLLKRAGDVGADFAEPTVGRPQVAEGL